MAAHGANITLSHEPEVAHLMTHKHSLFFFPKDDRPPISDIF